MYVVVNFLLNDFLYLCKLVTSLISSHSEPPYFTPGIRTSLHTHSAQIASDRTSAVLGVRKGLESRVIR